jgi:hypothetical protein
VLTLRGLLAYYILFFIHVETRRVEVAGVNYWGPDFRRGENWLNSPLTSSRLDG